MIETIENTIIKNLISNERIYEKGSTFFETRLL